MIAFQVDVDELRSSTIIMVLEPDNLERMKQADPITLVPSSGGGALRPFKYPNSVGLLIAYEPDPGPLYEMAKDNESAKKIVPYLMRGYEMTGKDGLVANRITDDDAKAVGAVVGERLQDPTLAALFAEAMNNFVAPVTKAWDRFSLETIVVKPGDIQGNEARFTLTLTAKRKGT
jgi:hypothetical protein